MQQKKIKIGGLQKFTIVIGEYCSKTTHKKDRKD